MTRVAAKINLSSLQVLRTLEILLQGNYTMQELVAKLNVNKEKFNNSVVSKYINTCRYCGIEIPKIYNKYVVASMPFGLELESSDINLLENIQNVVKKDMSSKYNKIFDGFIEKLNRFSNKKIARVDKETYHILSEYFEMAIKEHRKIRLALKNKTSLDCIPLNIVQSKGKTFFHVVNDKQDNMIDIDKIAYVEVLSERYLQCHNEQVVILELKDELAQRYHLRENERLLKPYDGHSMTIANHGESKEILLSRLLRYDNKCKILNPKSYRKDMKKIIEETLKNYAVND